MESLPDEMLVKIFGYLDIYEIHRGIGEVCARWKKVATTAALNRRIRVKTTKEWNFLLRMPKSTKRHLASVWIGPKVRWAYEDMIGLIDDLPHSTLPDVRESYCLQDAMLVAVADYFIKLRRLDAPDSHHNPTLRFLNVLRNLEAVVLRRPCVLYWMSGNCLRAKAITLHEVDLDEHLEVMDLLRARGDHLIKLVMRYPYWYTFKDFSVCRNLKELRMYHCYHVEMDALMSLVVLKGLSVLHITRTLSISPGEFRQFMRALDVTQLIDLNMCGTKFSNRSANYLVNKNPPLQRLVLSRCPLLSAKGALHILENFTTLNQIILDGTTILSEEEKFRKYDSILECFPYNDDV